MNYVYGAEMAENPLVLPDAETRSRLSGYPDLSPAEARRMDERSGQVAGT